MEEINGYHTISVRGKGTFNRRVYFLCSIFDSKKGLNDALSEAYSNCGGEGSLDLRTIRILDNQMRPDISLDRNTAIYLSELSEEVLCG